jgi:hypothetical protein
MCKFAAVGEDRLGNCLCCWVGYICLDAALYQVSCCWRRRIDSVSGIAIVGHSGPDMFRVKCIVEEQGHPFKDIYFRFLITMNSSSVDYERQAWHDRVSLNASMKSWQMRSE